MAVKWEIRATELDDEWFVSCDLNTEWVDFPANHPDALWLGRFIKHAALMDQGEELHNAFCKVCTW